MTQLKAEVTWVDARAELPRVGMPVAAAITGRYPEKHLDEDDGLSGREFWLVRPMVFFDRYTEESGEEHESCFVDADEVIRLPYGLPSEETVTHWAYLPALPGGATHGVLGDEVRPALRHAWETSRTP